MAKATTSQASKKALQSIDGLHIETPQAHTTVPKDFLFAAQRLLDEVSKLDDVPMSLHPSLALLDQAVTKATSL